MRDIKKLRRIPFLITSTFAAGTPSSSYSYQPASRVPFTLSQCRIVGDRKKLRQYGLIQLLSEGLSLFVATLPLAFQSMTQHFMKKTPEARPESSAGPS